MSGGDEHDTVVDRAYRLILGREADPEGAAGYADALRAGELSTAEVCASLASSDEFARRLTPTAPPKAPKPTDPNHVDPADLIDTLSVEDLAKTADDYFRNLENPESLLAKPLHNADEAPDLLITFGHVLRALKPTPHLTVLDFGAGTCWTSRWLTQLGCRVIALDVSEAALAIGKELFERQPVLGNVPDPDFLHFDGHQIDLPAASVDSVLCYDALHHVPNPAEVIAELARVLRPGGVAAFSEPGPDHSRTERSQHEMQNHGVLENDIDIDDVWDWAQRAGFADIRLCLLDSGPAWVDLATFHDVIAGREDETVFVQPTRAAVSTRRMFSLSLPDAEV
ncbi:MAG: methyltransferase domain-containing protein [Mycobacterium sp.]|nr:methyltransferase domain-containing protein [Mycobacterium sp.]